MGIGPPGSAVVRRDILEQVFHSSADCIKLLDLEGRLLLMNEGGARSMELDSASQLLGSPWPDFWVGPQREDACAALDAAKRGGVGRCQGYLPTAKDCPKWWESVVTPVRNADGAVASLLVMSRDVTEKHELAVALKAAADRTNALIKATSEIVWRSDALQSSDEKHGWAEFRGTVDREGEAPAWREVIHPDDQAEVLVNRDRGIRTGSGYVNEYRLRHWRGDWRWVEDRAVPLKNDDGIVLEWVGVIKDIHDRVCATLALRDREERLRLAVKASEVGIWDVDLHTGERRWSDELKRMMGLPLDVEPTEAILLERIHPEDRQRITEAHRTTFVQVSGPASVTFRIMRDDTNELRWIVSKGQVILDENRHPVRRIGTWHDITERKLAERELWIAANRDTLTALPNRAFFNRELDRALADASSNRTRVALLIIDVDEFKDVNDTLGHDAGDALLRTVAERLLAHTPASATVARLGGDEFAVLLSDGQALEAVEARAAVLVRELARAFSYASGDLNCTASIGLAVYPDHDKDGAELLKNADLALYAAKRAGRARHAVFDPAMRTHLHTRMEVLQCARTALAQGDIVPYYQPKVSPWSTEAGGFEALLRWRDGKGLQPPAAMADAFLDPDIAAQIGDRMLDLVIADILRWRASGLTVGSVAVNVSAAEFIRVDVAQRWLDRIDRAGLPVSSLQMEVTETVLLGDGAEAVGKALFRLHDRGVEIALDDFGTGYASLTHLRQYPVDWLKIDRSFIGDLGTDKSADAIVSAVISLARALDLKVVAEGVETRAQAGALKSQGCDLLQGYLIAKPMAASRVPHFLRSWAGLSPKSPVARRRARAS